MDTIKVTSGMEDIKTQLDNIYSNIIPLTTNVNNNLDKIRENWKGTRSDSVLKELETIKNNNNKIPDNLKRNIDFIDEAYKKYKELEAARIAQAQSTPTPIITPGVTPTGVPITPSPTASPTLGPTGVPITPSPTSTPGVTPTGVPITPSPTSTPGVTPAGVPITPLPTSTPGVTPTVVPITPTPQTTTSTIGTTKITNEVLKQLGVKFVGEVPQKYGGAYIVKTGKMECLLFLPENYNKEISKNLPVLIEFHGSSSAIQAKIPKITNMKTIMGLKKISDDPNLQAIILIPHFNSPDLPSGEMGDLHNLENNVINDLETNSQVFLYGHSAGGLGVIKYATKFPDNIKGILSVDGRLYAESLKTVSKDIPILMLTSDAGISLKSDVQKQNYYETIHQSYKELGYGTIMDNISSKDPDVFAKINKAMNETMKSGGWSTVRVTGTGHEEVRDLAINEADIYGTILKTYYNNILSSKL